MYQLSRTVQLLSVTLTSKHFAENDIKNDVPTSKGHPESCMRVVLHPPCKRTFPCISQSHSNSYQVCKNKFSVISAKNGTQDCVISSDPQVENYPLFKQMVEEVRLKKEQLNRKDKSPAGITLAAGTVKTIWARSWDYGTYHISDQRRLKCASVSPEPLLFAFMKNGSRQRGQPKIRHLTPLDGCTCAFEECLLRRTESTIISWHVTLTSSLYYQKQYWAR